MTIGGAVSAILGLGRFSNSLSVEVAKRILRRTDYQAVLSSLLVQKISRETSAFGGNASLKVEASVLANTSCDYGGDVVNLRSFRRR